MAYTESTYFKLRSRLDAFEAMALTYCLNAETDEEAQARVDFILENLPLDSLKNNLSRTERAARSGPKCPPEAPYLCGNECLPYPCPTK